MYDVAVGDEPRGSNLSIRDGRRIALVKSLFGGKEFVQLLPRGTRPLSGVSWGVRNRSAKVVRRGCRGKVGSAGKGRARR